MVKKMFFLLFVFYSLLGMRRTVLHTLQKIRYSAQIDRARKLGFLKQKTFSTEGVKKWDRNTARRLFKQTRDIDSECEHGNTLAHYCAKDGKPDSLAFLAVEGADLEVIGPSLRTPLICALEAQNEETALFLLLANGIKDIKHQDAFGQTAFDIAKKYNMRSIIYVLKKQEE